MGALSNQYDTPHVVKPTTSTSRLEITLASLEGASSFGKQTIFASQMLEQNSSSMNHDPAVSNSLSILRKVIDGRRLQDNAPVPPGQNLESSYNGRCEMPPSEFTIRLLQSVKGNPPRKPVFFGIDCLIQS